MLDTDQLSPRGIGETLVHGIRELIEAVDCAIADLKFAVHRGDYVDAERFAGAKLVKVRFTGAKMKNVKIDADTKMENVDFSGADLSDAKIEKCTVKKVIYDSRTKFPAGFDPRQYGFTKPGEKAADIVVQSSGKKSSVADDAMPKKKKKKKKKHVDDDDE